MKSSCDEANKESRLRFAWDVMNCFLDDAGRKKFICKAKKIKTCTSLLPDSALQIYTQFVNHADSICFYQEFLVCFWVEVNKKMWQKKMELTTTTLVSSVEQTKDELLDCYVVLSG